MPFRLFAAAAAVAAVSSSCPVQRRRNLRGLENDRVPSAFASPGRHRPLRYRLRAYGEESVRARQSRRGRSAFAFFPVRREIVGRPTYDRRRADLKYETVFGLEKKRNR